MWFCTARKLGLKDRLSPRGLNVIQIVVNIQSQIKNTAISNQTPGERNMHYGNLRVPTLIIHSEGT